MFHPAGSFDGSDSGRIFQFSLIQAKLSDKMKQIDYILDYINGIKCSPASWLSLQNPFDYLDCFALINS